jgi:hypothetical protein
VPGGAGRPVGDDGLGEQVAEQVVAALGMLTVTLVAAGW